MSQKTDKNANRIFEKIIPALKIVLVLLIIFCIASTFYKTRSVRLLINLLIGIPVVLIFARYMKLFFGTSENYTSADIGYKSQYTDSRSENVISVLKKIWVVMILLSILGVAYVFPQLGRTPPRDRSRLDINYYNAPEGTAYVDILGKIDSSDENYTEFNIIPQKLISRGIDNEGSSVFNSEPIDINENSEIAKYDADGYKSLSIHSTYVTDFDVLKPYGYEHDDMMLKCSAEKLYKQYGKFRLAYVGEHGEVLGVTKKTSHTYDFHADYAVIANGDKATYSDWDFSPLTYAAFYIIQLTFYVTVIVIAVSIINHAAEKISWNSWVREQTRKDRDNNGESGRNL